MELKRKLIAGRFGTVPGRITLAFKNQAAEYHIRRDQPRIGPILAALAESWSRGEEIEVTLSGAEVVDARKVSP